MSNALVKKSRRGSALVGVVLVLAATAAVWQASEAANTRDDLRTSASTLEQREEDLRGLEQRLSEAEDKNRSLSAELASAKRNIASLDDEIDDLQSDLDDAYALLEGAVSAQNRSRCTIPSEAELRARIEETSRQTLGRFPTADESQTILAGLYAEYRAAGCV